jgi:ribonuclease HI
VFKLPSYKLYTDGSTDSNLFPCGFGGVVLVPLETNKNWCGVCQTNYVGELTAILRGCIHACELGEKQ